MALVIGWDDGRTVQYEGICDEPAGNELEQLKALYFERFQLAATVKSLPISHI